MQIKAVTLSKARTHLHKIADKAIDETCNGFDNAYDRIKKHEKEALSNMTGFEETTDEHLNQLRTLGLVALGVQEIAVRMIIELDKPSELAKLLCMKMVVELEKYYADRK
jgi:hypothetical protein